MRLHELAPAKGARKSRKRVGRGVASGQGKTAGKGSKGQKARSGGKVRPGFEGGQMPLHRRLPKSGFTNIFKKKIAAVNIRDLVASEPGKTAKFESGSVVDEAALVRVGLIKGRLDGVKLLGQGEITYPLNVKLALVSKSAREKIVAAGGTVAGNQQ
jgi:large subunit ribosomal protein L15